MNRTSLSKAADGRRLWTAQHEVYLTQSPSVGPQGPVSGPWPDTRLVVLVFQVFVPETTGPNTLLLLSCTWEDTREPAVISQSDLQEVINRVAYKENNYDESWDDNL